MNDSWQSGNPYEYFMGRWSKLVANAFVDWLHAASGLRWLDVGCGSGSLSETILSKSDPQSVVAIDQSEGFVRSAQQRLGNRVDCRIADALSLPINTSSVDITVSGLVLNFIASPEKALAEMQRVTVAGGKVAAYIWDYAGNMEFLQYFWDAAVELNPAATALHERHRFASFNADTLCATFKRAGIADVEQGSIDIVTRFSNFDDFWQPFLGGQGPAPTYVSKLTESDKNKLCAFLQNRLPFQADGSLPLSARAWAIQGTR